MPKNPKTTKQLTLDSLPNAAIEEVEKANRFQEKRIIITQIDATTKEDELALKISFKLLPSKTAFPTVKLDLWFDTHQISSFSIRIPQGPLSSNEFELPRILDMKGIPAGTHTIKAEMYELGSSGEKACQVVKEVAVDYVPKTRESRFVKVPSVRSVAGADLAVVSNSEKEIYIEIDRTMKKEQISKRDVW